MSLNLLVAQRTCVVGATLAAGSLLAWSASPRVVALVHPGPGSNHAGAATLDVMVVDLATSAAAVIWLVMAAAVVWTLMVELVSARWPSHWFHRFAGPAGWRRLVLGTLGLSFVAPTVTGAPGWAGDEHPHRRCDAVCAVEIVGLQLPQLQPDGIAERPQRTSLVTVQRGDSLWLIATRQLRASAGDGAVARFSTRLYDVNRAEIGPDPDLIFAGTRLISPGGTSHAH